MVVIGVAEWVLIQFARRHVWVVVTVVAVNLLTFWLLLKSLVLRSIVFPYGLNFIKHQVNRQLNEKYCLELRALVESVNRLVHSYFLQERHVCATYKDLVFEGNKISRFVEFLEKYVPANRQFIEDDAAKLQTGKRRRTRVSR